MSSITKVISSKFDDLKNRIVKVLRFGKDDVVTAYQASPYGIDSSPIKDMVAIHANTSVRGEDVIVGYINKDQVASPGEIRIHNDKNYIHIKDTGIIEIGGNTDHLVLHSVMQTQFNILRNDLNMARAALSLPPTIADITNAKTLKIKTS